jgi:hypothetical protein
MGFVWRTWWFYSGGLLGVFSEEGPPRHIRDFHPSAEKLRDCQTGEAEPGRSSLSWEILECASWVSHCAHMHGAKGGGDVPLANNYGWLFVNY